MRASECKPFGNDEPLWELFQSHRAKKAHYAERDDSDPRDDTLALGACKVLKPPRRQRAPHSVQ